MTASPTEQLAADVADVLGQLQQSASVVAGQMRATNRAFYGRLAEVYLWWRAASAVDGYLNAEYAKLGRRFKSKVNYGITRVSSLKVAPMQTRRVVLGVCSSL